MYFVRDELCGGVRVGGGGTEQQRRRSHGEAQGGTGSTSGSNLKDNDGQSGVREEESLDALLVHGEHRSVRINWDGEADLPETGRKTTFGGMIPLNLKLGGGLKAFWNDVGKDAVKRFLTSARPN